MATQAQESPTIEIGEVAARTLRGVDTIRFYEKRRLLPAVNRSRARFRLYKEDAIERLRLIRQMQRLGFWLRAIRELIELRTHQREDCESVHRLLAAKRSAVRVKIASFVNSNWSLPISPRRTEVLR